MWLDEEKAMVDRPVRRSEGKVKPAIEPSSASIIITGGGTAGHTNPGIAVAQALVDRGVPRGRIHFIGGRRGNEGRLVTEAGFTIDLLPGRGIQRRLTVENLKSMIDLAYGSLKGLAIVAKRRPDAVLCLGGYAAFAASAAAVLLGIPLVVSEQNARASAVNRLFGRWARRCALPFPDTDLPNGEVTGNPIRAEVLQAVSDAEPTGSRHRLVERYNRSTPGADLDRSALDDRILIAVWAGSLGATRINQAVSDLASVWADRQDLAIYHVVGSRDWDKFRAEPAGNDGLAYLTVDYENHMADLLVGADLAVCRSGASTVAEISVAGLPSVLVPFPGATRDHQRANTAELTAAGGAVVVGDADVTGERLASLLGPLIPDPAAIAAMSAAARSVARPGAADAVAGLLLSAAAGDDSTDQAQLDSRRSIEEKA